MDNTFCLKPLSYLKESMADVKFSLTSDKGRNLTITAHKCLLSSGSNVFEKMFSGQWKEKDIVEIHGASQSAFLEFLQFFYLPTIALTTNNIVAVAHLTDKYNLTECFAICVKFIKKQLPKENVISAYQLAIELKHQPGAKELKEFCEGQIKVMSSDDFRSSSFLNCSPVTLKQILEMEALMCSEFDLFNSCVEWAKASCQRRGVDGNVAENVKRELGECFYLIRFGSITYEKFGIMLSDQLVTNLFSRDELAEIIRLKSDDNFESNTFKWKHRSIQAYKWIYSDALTCGLPIERESRHLDPVMQLDSTWFSSTHRVLLGTIELHPLYKKYLVPFTGKIELSLELVQYNSQTVPVVDTPSKIVYGPVSVNFESGRTNPISTPSPILIQPKKIYEIRFTLKSGSYRDANHYPIVWKPKVPLDDIVAIKFHQDLKGQTGWLVSSMHFNRLTD